MKKKHGAGKAAASHPSTAGVNDRWRVMGVCIFLIAIIWAVFGQTLGHEFVLYDDNLYVADNPVVLAGLSLKGIVWAFTHNVNFNWTPLTVISHMLDCQFYGTNAGWHHLTSVLLHMVTAILLFLILRAMTNALWRSAFVAAVFAIHPLHVESVAWIAERRDVLSGVFFMLTIGAYVRYTRNPRRQSYYLTVMVLFALGLMSKPMLVTLPFVLLLLDYWPLKRFNPPENRSVARRLIVEKIPLLALSFAACVATLFTQKEAIAPLPISVRISNALVSYVIYLKQMIYPVGLTVYYPHLGSGLAPWKIILAIVLLLVISLGAFSVRRTRPWILFGWLWYVGMMIPVIGLIQSGLRAQADRYTYLPQIGLYVLLTWLVADLVDDWRYRRAVLGGLATLVLVALVFCARNQASYWRNSESLWTHAVNCTTDSALAQNMLGNELLQRGNLDAAMEHYQTALQIKPDYAEADNNLGDALFQKGRLDEAIARFQMALLFNPEYPVAHNNLGNALLQKGRVDAAIAHYQMALQLQPDYAEAQNNLGNVFLQKGGVDEAIVHYQMALQLQPDYAKAHNNLGNAWLQKGRMDEAIAQYQIAIQLQPNYVKAHFNLANAFFQQGRVDEAIDHYQMSLRFNPDYAKARYNLAIALLKMGKVGEATTQFQMAIELARATGQTGFMEQIRQQLVNLSGGVSIPAATK